MLGGGVVVLRKRRRRIEEDIPMTNCAYLVYLSLDIDSLLQL